MIINVFYKYIENINILFNSFIFILIKMIPLKD